MVLTMSLLRAAAEKHVWKHALKKLYEVLGRVDCVTELEYVGSCEIRKKVPNTDVGSWDHKRNALPLSRILIRLIRIHAEAVFAGRGQGGLLREEPKTNARVGRLQVDVVESPAGDATSRRRAWSYLRSADRRTDKFGARVLPDNCVR